MINWLLGKNKAKEVIIPAEKDDFVSLSSHELRGPLSIIKWYTEILLDGDMGPLTDDQKKYLTVIEMSNKRAIDLVRSLLNVSRLDLGTFRIVPVTVDVQACAHEVITLLQSEVLAKNLTITVEEEGTLPALQADIHFVMTVLKNLISNAVAFSPHGGTITIILHVVHGGTVVAGTSVLDESILIEVNDNGIGIPVVDQDKIFSRMVRGSNVDDSSGTGSGLGLYITKTILEYVGGKVWFVSQENVGSTFYAAFPTKGMKKKEGRTTLD